MKLQKDFKEFLQLLNEHEIQYVIVGGYAFSVHVEPRYTKDLDLLINSDKKNARKVLVALNEFGFGSLDIDEEDLTDPNQIIQLGNAPVRIDIVSAIDGVLFNTIWKNKIQVSIDDIEVYMIGITELLANKEATGRLQDQADAEKLKKILNDTD